MVFGRQLRIMSIIGGQPCSFRHLFQLPEQMAVVQMVQFIRTFNAFINRIRVGDVFIKRIEKINVIIVSQIELCKISMRKRNVL